MAVVRTLLMSFEPRRCGTRRQGDRLGLALSDILIDQPVEFVDPMLLDRPPYFKRPEPARGLQAVFVQPWRCRQPAKRRRDNWATTAPSV
jgi:hypothetical protein